MNGIGYCAGTLVAVGMFVCGVIAGIALNEHENKLNERKKELHEAGFSMNGNYEEVTEE